MIRRINKSSERGFTLLEVLVALVIMSIGLLGLAGLMVNSLKNNQSAAMRSQAAWLAYDIIDRMRANRPLALPVGGAASPYAIAIGDDPSGTGTAATDLTAWRANLVSAMSGGTGAVVVDTATGEVTVSVQWDDSRSGGAEDSEKTFTMDTRL
jgi:type IV pilus assembly protein PilV